MDRTLEDMARTLVESGGYRIIRRLGPQTEYHSPDSTPKLIGAVVDVETSGTDIARGSLNWAFACSNTGSRINAYTGSSVLAIGSRILGFQSHPRLSS